MRALLLGLLVLAVPAMAAEDYAELRDSLVDEVRHYAG